MQNKKVALAVAAALAIPAAAHADATIYGFVSGSVESIKLSGNASQTTTRVSDENSRIGFKGTDDLGNGLKAIWQVESRLHVDGENGADTLGTRNTFVGLQDNAFGTVQLGNYDSAYKRLTDIGLNVLTNTTADTQGGGAIFSRLETRLKNSVHYTSPVFSGLQVGASYGWDEVAAPTSKNRWDIAAQYNNSGLALTAGYDSTGDNINAGAAGKTNTTQGYKLGAAYTIPGVGAMVGAGFERVTNKVTGSSDQTQNDWILAATYPIGALTLKGSYAQLGSLSNPTSGASDDYKAKQWVLGASYDLSKKTQAYAYATKITNNAAAKVDFGVDAVGVAAGVNAQAVGLGLKTVF